jgi:hypothetical protein
MSKFVKLLAIATLIAGAFVMTPGPAAARWGHGWHHGGWGWGPGPFWGWGGYPYGYAYGGPYYYGGRPGCGYVRVWRRHRWVLVRNWRCY